MKLLLTELERAKRNRDEKVRKMYTKLTAEKGCPPTLAEAKVMKKFGIKARSTVWSIVKKNQPKDNNGEDN